MNAGGFHTGHEWRQPTITEPDRTETIRERHRRELDKAFRTAAQLFRDTAGTDEDPDWK